MLGAGIYSVVIIMGLAVLRTRLSASLAFGLMGAGALVSSLFLLVRLGNYLNFEVACCQTQFDVARSLALWAMGNVKCGFRMGSGIRLLPTNHLVARHSRSCSA